MTEMTKPTAVHLVGSIGLDTVEDVFRTVGKTLGPYLRRAPDGEVGGRKLWISWQYPLLRASVFLTPDPSGAVRPTNKFSLLTLADGVKSQDVHFGELGYAREARACRGRKRVSTWRAVLRRRSGSRPNAAWHARARRSLSAIS
jgi:hypothetical protein